MVQALLPSGKPCAYCALSSIGGAAVFLQCFIDNLPTVKLCWAVSRLKYQKLLKVLGQICTQNNIKCSRKVILTFFSVSPIKSTKYTSVICLLVLIESLSQYSCTASLCLASSESKNVSRTHPGIAAKYVRGVASV